MEILIIFAVSTVASFVCAGVGGAGLIVTPCLIFLGFTPQNAIATDLFGAIGGSLSSWHKFRKKISVDKKLMRASLSLVMLGVLCGTLSAITISGLMLRRFMGAMMLFALILILWKRELGIKERSKVEGWLLFWGYAAFFIVGVWGSIVGGGFLVISNYILIGFFGLSMLQSAPLLALISLMISTFASIIFGLHGQILFPQALAVLVGKSIGSYWGAQFALLAGNQIIKALFGIVVASSATKLIFF